MSQAVVKTPPVTQSLPSPTVVVFSLILLATIGAIAWAASELSDPTALPIRRVQIEGEFKHLDPEHLQEVVVGVVDAGFFRVDVARVRERLLDEPWIREATIRRVWPESLHVSIVEQHRSRVGANRRCSTSAAISSPHRAKRCRPGSCVSMARSGPRSRCSTPTGACASGWRA